MEAVVIWILSAILGNLDQATLVWVIGVLAAIVAFEQAVAQVPWVKANSTCQLVFGIVRAVLARVKGK